MFRNDRYFKKNDGQHNFFGEEDMIVSKNGTVVRRFDSKKESPPKQSKVRPMKKSG